MNTKETVIVAGITRSGLTATMQMLAGGGFPCLGEYPGFEPYGVGQVPWQRCEGLAVKLVDTHNHFPPPGRYRVLRLSRDFEQQARSFNKWATAIFGLPPLRTSRLIAGFRRDYEKIDRWASQQMGVMRIRFDDLIGKPLETATAISRFLGVKLDVDAMAAAIIKRSPDCYPGLLELEMLKAVKA